MDVPPPLVGAGRPEARTGAVKQIMAHCIAIIMPLEDGDRRVVFPDIAKCEAHGFDSTRHGFFRH
jgi:hypothetical protein